MTGICPVPKIRYSIYGPSLQGCAVVINIAHILYIITKWLGSVTLSRIHRAIQRNRKGQTEILLDGLGRNFTVTLCASPPGVSSSAVVRVYYIITIARAQCTLTWREENNVYMRPRCTRLVRNGVSRRNWVHAEKRLCQVPQWFCQYMQWKSISDSVLRGSRPIRPHLAFDDAQTPLHCSICWKKITGCATNPQQIEF